MLMLGWESTIGSAITLALMLCAATSRPLLAATSACLLLPPPPPPHHRRRRRRFRCLLPATSRHQLPTLPSLLSAFAELPHLAAAASGALQPPSTRHRAGRFHSLSVGGKRRFSPLLDVGSAASPPAPRLAMAIPGDDAGRLENAAHALLQMLQSPRVFASVVVMALALLCFNIAGVYITKLQSARAL